MKILKTKRDVDLENEFQGLGGHKNALLGVMGKGKRLDRKNFGLTWQKAGSGIKNKLAGKLVGDMVKLVINLAFLPNS